ncbi:MAG: MOP flippase family protein [Thermodesulfobacteriota bacterium]
MSLIDITTSSVRWSSIAQIGKQFMQWVTTLVLTQQLSPNDFGLISMALVVTGFISLFNNLGTSAAIIQKDFLSEALLSSLFWINLVFGLLSMVLIILVAPIASYIYHEPRVIPILRVLSFSFLISGLSIIQQALFERDLAFQRLAKIELVAVTSGSVVGIVLAFLGASVWSLVFQTLVTGTIITILLWTFSEWKPRFIFCWKDVKSVSRYSLNLFGFHIFNYFSRNADYLLIGRFLGAQNLGYYTIAYRIMFYPIQTISSVIGRVMFPVYSQIQNDNIQFRNIYLSVTASIAVFTFPIMVGLWGISRLFTITLLGSKWEPIIYLLKILAPVGMVQSIITTVGTIYQAKGRTDWMLRLGIVVGFSTIIAFVIGLKWGITGIAISYAIVTGIFIYPNLAIPYKLINLPIRDLGKSIWRPFFACMVMLIVVLSSKYVLTPVLTSRQLLAILVSVGIIIYFFSSWWINRDQIQEILNIIGIHGGARN